MSTVKKIFSLSLFFTGLFTSNSFSQVLQMQENVNWLNEYYLQIDLDGGHLPVNHTKYDRQIISFKRSSDDVQSIWGRGREYSGVYPKELLPALFTRKIVFDQFSPAEEGQMFWIFNGEAASFTIVLSKDKIRLTQRFYDSYGLIEVDKDKKINFPRHPEKEFISAETALIGDITNVAVTVGHDMTLRVYLNNREIIRQACIFDVNRHQIRFSGQDGSYSGKILGPQPKLVDVEVVKETKYQEMLGFGAITSVVAYHELSNEGKNRWWDYIREYNLLIQREYPVGSRLKPDFSNWDDINDAAVHYYGDNFPNGEISDFNYNKKIQEMGGFVIFEFWRLPTWAVVKNEKGLPTSVPLMDKYTEAVINYCKMGKAKTGRPPAIVGIQNEVRQTPDVWREMTLALREALDENGFEEVKIHMYNASLLKNGIEAARAFSENQQVWNSIDYAATNLYDYQNYFMNADGYDSLIYEWNRAVKDKPFISTEMAVNSSKYQHDSYRLAFAMGQLYHKNLNIMNASALMYCWGLLNGPQKTYDATRSLFRIDYHNNCVPVPSSFQLRVFGAFSRKIAKGQRRIMGVSSDSDLLVSAYSDGEKETLVLMNRSFLPVEVNLNNGKSKFGTAEVVDQYSENKKVDPATVFKDNKLIIQGGQIITFRKGGR